IVPENPVTAIEPGKMTWPSCACAAGGARLAPIARAAIALPAASLRRSSPVVRLQASKRSTPRLRGMVLLLPIRVGETARRDARQEVKRAFPALSPLAVRMESLLSRIGRVLRMVNGLDPEPGAPGSSPGFSPRLLPGDPGDLLHMSCLVMGLSLFQGPHNCGAWASVAAGSGKVHRTRWVGGSAS